jgi:hypothetical protein
MSERRAVQGEFFALLVALRDSRERMLAAWAADVPLDDPAATATLLNALREADVADQVLVLATRAAAHAPLDHPDVYVLLDALRETGEQFLVLAARAAAHASFDNPAATAWLLNALREAGAADQVLVLLARHPAAHAPLDDPSATVTLLNALREADAADQVLALAARAAPARTPQRPGRHHHAAERATPGGRRQPGSGPGRAGRRARTPRQPGRHHHAAQGTAPGGRSRPGSGPGHPDRCTRTPRQPEHRHAGGYAPSGARGRLSRSPDGIAAGRLLA